ncbi:MAG: orotidine-5'-phosphate decarboxylase [Nitrospirota bacterium]|nr:orotidine-5'-phosphate decarboxylase [Nitrospirota bacterium]
MSDSPAPGSPPSIPVRERLIVALDVTSAEQARAMVRQLGDAVAFYKIGLELLMADGFWDLTRWLGEQGKRVFADIKMYDVPETVRRAVENLARHPVDFATVHGNDAILQAAAGAKGHMQILAVTVLTSLDQNDLGDMGLTGDPQQLVLSRAGRARQLGCDGVIASGLEAPLLRKTLGEGFLIVTPGIRPPERRGADDQKRTVDVEEAFRGGADYIVMGRPIRDAADPRRTAEAVQARIQAIFSR